MRPNPQFPPDLVTFTREILNGKLHFLGSVGPFVRTIKLSNSISMSVAKFSKESFRLEISSKVLFFVFFMPASENFRSLMFFNHTEYFQLVWKWISTMANMWKSESGTGVFLWNLWYYGGPYFAEHLRTKRI